MEEIRSSRGGVRMKVLGIKCSKTELGWMVLEGTSRSDAGVVAHDQAKAPPKADRAETLAWGRKELLEVIEKHHPDVAALRATEGQSGSFERAEMDGVVQATLYELDIPVSRLKAVTIRSKYKARDNQALEAATSELPALTDKSTKAQRELLVTAAAILPN
jgi:Holliday junction resolvasome RuvABC endonuclease subunit